MSLISEALKKTEQQRRAGGRPAAATPIRLRPPGPRARKGRLLLAGVAALCTGTVLAGVFFFPRGTGVEPQGPAPAVLPEARRVIARQEAAAPVQSTDSRAAAGGEQTPGPRIARQEAPAETAAAPEVVKPAPQAVPPSPKRRARTQARAGATAEKVTAATAKLKGAGERKGRPDKAVTVRLDSETLASPLADYREAVALQRQEKWGEAIAAYRRVLSRLPKSAQVYNNLGVIYEKQGDLREAADCYKKAIDIDPSFYPSFNNLGIVYYRLEDYPKARAAYEQALALNPDNSQSLINLALVYKRLGRADLARQACEQVLAREPDNPEAHYNLALLLEEHGERREALSHYRRFLEIEPATAYPGLREAVQARISRLQAAVSSQ